MTQDDRHYFETRARAALALAARATNPAVERTHQLFARHYLEKLRTLAGGPHA